MTSKTKQPNVISLCKNCNCMTKTRVGNLWDECLKCGKPKAIKKMDEPTDYSKCILGGSHEENPCKKCGMLLHDIAVATTPRGSFLIGVKKGDGLCAICNEPKTHKNHEQFEFKPKKDEDSAGKAYKNHEQFEFKPKKDEDSAGKAYDHGTNLSETSLAGQATAPSMSKDEQEFEEYWKSYYEIWNRNWVDEKEVAKAAWLAARSKRK